MKRKPVVGEVLYDLNVGNAARHKKQELTPVSVVSVGRKYFTCKSHAAYPQETTYHIDTWAEKSECSPDHRLYESEQEWLDETEARSLFDKLRFGHFGYHMNRLPLTKLRAIKEIIESEE